MSVVLGAALVLGRSVIAPAWADTAAAEAAPADDQPEKGEALSQVVVTAERRSENLQSVPISVTAVGADQVRAFQIHSNEDLANFTPGLPGTRTSRGFAPVGSFFDTQSAPFHGTPLLPYGQEKQGGVMLKAEYDLSWAHLLGITAHRAFRGYNVVDNDATPLDLASGRQFQRGHTLTQEFQVLSQPDATLKWMAGVFLFNDNQGEHPVINGPSLIRTTDNQHVWSYAPFAQATYPILENTRFTAGVRYTADDKHQTGAQISGAGAPLATFDHSIMADKFTYLASLDHDFTQDILGYVSASRGFRSGNFNNLNPAATPTKPQTVDAVEVGLDGLPRLAMRPATRCRTPRKAM